VLIDAIMYNGESDILEIRIAELSPIVDAFVIVESLEYHGSDRKKENPPPVTGPKIHYTCLDHLEPAFSRETCWLRENYHRRCLMPHVAEVASSSLDILMMSDCDEIPRAIRVACSPDTLLACDQDMFYYNVNNYTGPWHGTIIGTIEEFGKVGGLQAARNMRDALPIIHDCGWHFSYFGGLERIRHKTKNFAHGPEDICKLFQYQPDEEVLKDIAEGRDLYHRPGPLFEKRSSDDLRLPKYFLANKERFPLWTT
jgi:hypothetical protein